ncbi:hypothetical protein FCM35_KLT22060 [Carex littledalei]|uniref:Uncharacterized protein n=1 Tax=Carex littledalei TaxID=544730 RepID=A0A833Q6Z8_9POAL|nr:hypothetical protein FCM35_KLT22060 [Carex littledalei]
MLQLEPFTEDRGRPAVITRSSASLRLPGFSTRRLARMSDSLVRVSRRVGWGARRPTRPQRSAAGARGERARGQWPRPETTGTVVRRSGTNRARPGRIASPHPLPSRQFQALFDSLFKVLFIFPSRYLFAIGLSPVFSLGRSLPPNLGCIPKQPDSPTAPRGAAGSGPDGALTLPGAPFQGTWARSVAEVASPDYNSGGSATAILRLGCSRFARRY